MLRGLDQRSHPDLLVGTDTGDDAAVWRRPDGRALVSTADFFTPIVDDATTWGAIAAANAVSDVYAMGGTPLFALNLVAWPKDELPLDLLGEVLAGGQQVADEGGWIISGGHTVDAPEPMYGQSVTGEVDEELVLSNATAVGGQRLVLTKALGTGLLATAIKRRPAEAVAPGGELAEIYEAGVASMTRLNAEAAEAAAAAGSHTGTDVTGFGLLGHLHKILDASGLGASIDIAAVPVLAGAWDLLDEGFVAGGSERNLEHVESHLRGGDRRIRVMLADAQTSGGLLFACDAAAADEAVDRLRATGHAAAVIGELHEAEPGVTHLI